MYTKKCYVGLNSTSPFVNFSCVSFCVSTPVPKLDFVCLLAYSIECQISKKDADQFQPGQWIPECQLMVHWEREDQRPVRLRHKVNLVGAKDFFHLTLNPAMEGSESY